MQQTLTYPTKLYNERVLSRCRLLAYGVLLLLATCLIFHHTAQYQFVEWDDGPMVAANPLLHPVTVAHVRHFWAHPYDGLYAPLAYTLYSLLALLSRSDPNPQVFHLANLTLHCSNVLFVFVLMRKLVRHDAGAFFGALLFGIHPLQVEPVCWVGSLNTVLCAFFSLLALWQYLHFDEAIHHPSKYFAFATLFFICALMSKPSAVAVPLIAFVLQYGFFKISWKANICKLLGWGVLAAIWIGLTQYAQPFSHTLVTPFWQRPFVAGDAVAFYLVKLFIPTNLATDYGRTPAFVMHQTMGYLTWMLPAALGIFAWRVRRKIPFLWIGLGVFVVALLPVLGLVPFAFQEFSTVADRYCYLAMFGPALILAFLVSRSPRIVTSVVCCALILLSSQSLLQANYWRDSVTLLSHAVSVNPRSEIMHYNLANVFARQGQTQAAIDQYQDALHLMPSNAQAHCNLADLLSKQSKPKEAAFEYQLAITNNPNLAEAHYGLGLLLAEHGQLKDAIINWTETTRIWPNYLDAHYNLAMALIHTGDLKSAAMQLHEVLRINPGFKPAQQELFTLSL